MNTTQVIANNTKCFTGNLPASPRLRFLKKKLFFQEQKGLFQYSYYLPTQYVWPLLTSQATEDEVFKVSDEFKNATQHKCFTETCSTAQPELYSQVIQRQGSQMKQGFCLFPEFHCIKRGIIRIQLQGKRKQVTCHFIFLIVLGEKDL